MTTIAEIKSSLHQQVANTEDEKVLQKMQVYFRSLTKKGNRKVIAYTSKGKPLTSMEYKAEIEESIIQYKRDNVISQKEMESNPTLSSLLTLGSSVFPSPVERG